MRREVSYLRTIISARLMDSYMCSSLLALALRPIMLVALDYVIIDTFASPSITCWW
jgi:hypothetical protein